MIRAGILGAAGIAPRAFVFPVQRRDDIEVVAVAARAQADAFAATHGIPHAAQGYQELIDAGDIDLVYIALPPSAHAHWSIQAVQAGKDVLCEKPIAMNAVEAEAMATAAQRSGRQIIEAFHDAYHPLTAVTRDLVRGSIGELVSLQARFVVHHPFQPDSIRHVPELGGGALMDLGCYPVHWLRRVVGEPRVLSATAVLGPLGVDESIEAELELGEVPAHLQASLVGDSFDAEFEAVGTTGTVVIDNPVLPHRGHSVTLTQGGHARQFTVAGDETYDHELAAVIDALRTGAPSATGPTDFVATMRVIDAIYSAAGASRP